MISFRLVFSMCIQWKPQYYNMKKKKQRWKMDKRIKYIEAYLFSHQFCVLSWLYCTLYPYWKSKRSFKDVDHHYCRVRFHVFPPWFVKNYELISRSITKSLILWASTVTATLTEGLFDHSVTSPNLHTIYIYIYITQYKQRLSRTKYRLISTPNKYLPFLFIIKQS